MKRILIISSLIVVSCSAAIAQSQAGAQANVHATATTAGPVAATLSKNDFVAKVSEMTSVLNTNNADAANAKWTEMHQMLLTELGITKHHIFASEATKAHYTDIMLQQRNIYSAMIKLKGDLIANKAAMITNLNSFAATID
jgi:hypothetical protein